MAKRNEIYKCEKCGNIVEVTHGAGGVMVCCNENMKLMNENSTDAAVEKHVPVVEKTDGGYRVFVGSAEHPMVDDHYIEWIEILTETEVYRKFLSPNEKPEAFFKLDGEIVKARAYCNLHGLWRS